MINTNKIKGRMAELQLTQKDVRLNRVYLIWKSRHLICRQMASQLMALITVSQVLITSEVTYGT